MSSLGSVANRLRHLERDARLDSDGVGASGLAEVLAAATDEELVRLERAVESGDAVAEGETLAEIERRLDDRSPLAMLSPLRQALAVEIAARRQHLGVDELVETLTDPELERLLAILRAGSPVAGIGTALEANGHAAFVELEGRARARRERWARSRSGLLTRSGRSARARSLLERRRQAARVARQSVPLCVLAAPGCGPPVINYRHPDP